MWFISKNNIIRRPYVTTGTHSSFLGKFVTQIITEPLEFEKGIRRTGRSDRV